MSDAAIKAEKLAAARRKLKEHQTSKKSKTPSDGQEKVNTTTSEESLLILPTYVGEPVAQYEHPEVQQTLIEPQTFAFQQPTATPQQYNENQGPSLANYFSNGENPFDGNIFSQQTPQQQQVLDPFETFSSPVGYQNQPEVRQEPSVNNFQQDFASEQMRKEIEELRQQNETTNNQLLDLQTKLNSHIQTVNVLVEEKANLTNSLHKCEHLILQKNTETDELQNRLQASRHRLQEYENELTNSRQTRERYDETHQAINSELTKYQEEIKELRRVYEESQEDLAELKQKFSLKTNAHLSLQSELEKTRSDLHLAQLKVQQLSTADEPATSNGNMEQMVLIKDQQIEELRKIIDQINQERLLNDQKYQNYVISLNQERTSLAEQIQRLTADNQKAAQREESLVKHVGELEKQIQQQIQRQQQMENRTKEQDSETVVSKTPSTEELEKLKEQVVTLTAQLTVEQQKLAAVTINQQNLQFQLQAKQQQVIDQEMTIERLQVGRPDTANVMVEIESHKVTASRAVAQNQQLKDQLEEMQRAFVQMSNDKLDLTDRLQSEQHLGREMRNNYQQMETELGMLRDRFSLKDEEMIRMSHEYTELEKQIFQNNQELDRLRHYEAHGETGNILQLELQKTQEENRQLQAKVDDLEAKVIKSAVEHDHDHHHHEHDHKHEDGHDHKHEDGHGHKHEEGHGHKHAEGHDHKHGENCEQGHKAHETHTTHDLEKENEMLRIEKEELVKVINDLQKLKVLQNGTGEPVEASETVDDNRSETASTTASIATSEAMEKLQHRFKRTMQEVADLTEEKYRLEHLVQRLQSETETIGEYITLYQTQRRLLKQKDLERDTQLKSLAADRELMKNRLVELNTLIEQLIISKKQPVASPIMNGESNEHITPEANSANSDNNNQVQGATKTVNDGVIRTTENQNPSMEHVNKALDVETKQTADKILALLSDIKTANSNTFHTFSGVRHCSCCSGKLQTV